MKRAWRSVAAVVLVVTGCSQPPEKVATVRHADKGPRRVGQMVLWPEDSPQLRRIRVAVVEAADVPHEEVVAPGKVELNPGRVSRVALPVAGRVREVLVGLGDEVRQGQVVLTLESPEVPVIQSAIRQAEANVFQAKAALAKAEADLERSRDLLANRAVAQKEVLAAETAVAQARAALEQALAARDEAERRASILGIQPGIAEQLVTVHAPVPGKVTDVAVAAGEYRSDTAAPVLTISDLSTVWVAADVPEVLIRLIQVGERVTISLPAFPDRTYTGRVTRIGDVVDAETRTIKVRAELRNPGGQLRPEMFAQIRHDHGMRRLPVVPKAAVLQQEGRAVVYVERGAGRFEEVPVTPGWQGNDKVAITAGIQAGERVVTEGSMLLKGVAP
jgi:cobalt-zinc-cadmium efflux system membrane fusion protein